MKKAFVVGASGHARVVIDMIERTKRYSIAGLLDPFQPKGTIVYDHPILGGQQDIAKLSADLGVGHTIIGIGDNWDRYSVYNEIVDLCPAMNFVATVHPFSQVGKDVIICAGSVIMPGAVINSGVQIGKFCIVNTSASVDHECILDDFVSIAPGATLGGQVKVGKYSSISLGAKVIQKVSIGKHVVVGAGAVVLEDLPDRVVAHGAPARIVRRRDVGEKYL